jgi:hypothetical protein
MDELRDKFHNGRRDMLAAFVELSDLARRAGVSDLDISLAHVQFFDGNVAVKETFRVYVLLASCV